MTTVTMKKPDDMHVHFRQGSRMRSVAGHTARQFARAVIMPNTMPFIKTVDDAARYRDEIIAALPPEMSSFQPLMTLYLQTTTSPDTIRAAKKSGFIVGMKAYPHGQTTNSHGGIVRLSDAREQLKTMAEVDLPLLVHGEVADNTVDVFHREEEFYTESFSWLIGTFPTLRTCFEHITLASTVEIINRRAPAGSRIGATITPQHLLVDRNYMLGGMLRPHAFCKPILKKYEDRMTLLQTATSGDPRFFLGTDSAPHAKDGEAGQAKEVDCGCAGCFTAHAALELYAEAFDSVGGIDRLEAFASSFGARFYELPENTGTITLRKTETSVPASLAFGEDTVVPFRHDEPLQWKMES